MTDLFGEVLHPLVYVTFAGLVLYPWHLVWHLSRLYRSARQLATSHFYRNESEIAGLITPSGLIAFSERGYSRSGWSEIQLSMVADDRIDVALNHTDHRWTFPTEFFESDDAFNEARKAVVHHLVPKVKYAPDTSDLQGKSFRSSPPLSKSEMDNAMGWSEEQWPFAPGALVLNHECMPIVDRTPWPWIKHWLLCVWPLLAVIPIWLTVEYSNHGSFLFLSGNPIGTTAFFASVIFILVRFAWPLPAHMREHLESVTRPFTITLRQNGYSLRYGDHQYWCAWPDQLHLLLQPDSIGWKEIVDDAPFILPKAGLSDEEIERVETFLAKRQVN